MECYEILDYSVESYNRFLELKRLPMHRVEENRIYYEDNSGISEVETSTFNPRLFDYQKFIVSLALAKKRFAVFADVGLGKCHGKDTPIILSDGSVKKVQDICEGDLLMGPDSKTRTVLSTATGTGPLYKVTPVKGEPFVCNDAHILSLKCTSTKKQSKRYIKDKMTNIAISDYLKESILFKSFMKLWRVGVDIPFQSVPFDPYLVGIWMGDGTVNGADITVNNADTETIDFLRDWAKDNGYFIREELGHGCKTYHFRVNEDSSCSLKNGLTRFVKTVFVDGEKRIPKEYLQNCSSIRLQLLAGLVDSDAYHVDNCYEIVTKYPGLATDIAFLARSLGLAVTTRKVIKNIKSSGFSAEYTKIMIYGETSMVPCKVQRKKAHKRKQKKNVLRTGFSIEPLGEGEYYGFTLSGDGLYLLGDFTVTHNTLIFLEWVRHVSKTIYPKKTLIISQLHLIKQTMEEQLKFYGWTNILDINKVFGGDIEKFLAVKNTSWEGCPVGIVNIDKFNREYRLQDQVGAVVFDESSALANATGKQRTNIINSCKGIEYKLPCTATPNRNNRQEYASHCLFLGYIDNYKQFFTKYFYNTGSGNDFVLKPHAKTAFYEFLATWSIFLKNPARYGFDDNLADLKPAEVIWDKISLTDEQKIAAIKYGTNGQMNLYGVNVGGICHRSKVSQISKGFVYKEG